MKLFLASVFSVLAAFVFSAVIIPILTKRKIKQTVLTYVEAHKSKNGTPTMGGLIFILAVSVCFLLFSDYSSKSAFVTFFVALCGGITGFLDDFIKIKFGRNLGLKAYQKLIFQVVLALCLSVFAYLTLGTYIFVPFYNDFVDFGLYSLLLNFIAFIAVINSVNLTDGLDGLAASTSSLCLFFTAVTIAVTVNIFSSRFLNSSDAFNFLVLSVSAVGSLLAYITVNCFPAKIFMGDTGSMFLGALIGSLSILSGLTLFMLIYGIPFVVSGLSDVIQVFYFKLTKGKRVFKMAPFHHHLQMLGIHENRIVAVYSLITFLVSAIVLFFLIGGSYGLL